MSLDGLGTSGAFAGLVHPQRQSVDVASLQHMNSLGPSHSLNLNDLVSNMQGVNVQNQAQQNQQLTQLLINLLAEIDLNGQHQHLVKAQQQLQSNAALTNALSAMGPLPRWSVDGYMLAPTQFQSLAPNLQAPQTIVPGVLPALSAPRDAMFNRSASMEVSIRDAISQGFSSHGRVSIDNVAVMRPFRSPHLNLQQPAQIPKRKDPKKVSFKSVVDNVPARSSEEDSSGMSSGATSTDSRAPESYPANYPLDGADVRKSVDCSLPDPFILF